MEARAKVLGHPIHAMLVSLPLGLMMGAVCFDALYVISGSGQWALVSFWLIAGGVLSGLLAAPFGLLDWLKIPSGSRAKRVGAIHGLGNVPVLVLFGASWLLRNGNPTEPSALALILSFAGGGLAVVTGWLGGELVNRLSVGVDDGANINAPSSLSGRPAGEVAMGDD